MAVLNFENNSYLKVEFISESCFRLRHSHDNEFVEKSPYARYGIFDYSGNNPKVDINSSNQTQTYATNMLKLVIDKKNRNFSVYDLSGKPLVETANPLNVGKKDGFAVELAATPDENLYGLGDVDRDTLQRRGREIQMWVKNVRSYVPIPFLMSSKGWAVFSNITHKHYFDICKTDDDIIKIWSFNGETDLLFFAGNDFRNLISQYTDISGKPALLPKFGYGLTFVCNMQADAREMLEDALKFRDRDIPCDVIGVEPHWMETYYDKTVDKKLDPDRFWLPEWITPESDPYKDTFFGALERMGFNLSLWMCCDYDLSFEEERNAELPYSEEVYDEEMNYLPEKDDYEKDANIGHHPIYIDEWTKKDEPFFEHLKKFVDKGASAFKLDGAWQVNEHPDRKWGNGMDDIQMHNLYPLILSKQMSTGFTEHTNRRSMIYSSGGFAGIQKYAATWAGDTGGGPRPLASMLNHAMSGHVNTSCDMLVYTKEGIHFGFLQSWSQVNSWAYRRHPWYLGSEMEEVFRSYAKLRYSLIPYIYSTAYQAWLDSTPIMRPLPYVYPNDEKGSAIKTEYMLGDYLLVSCFTDELYLPEGNWIDYFTGQRYEGPVEMKYEFPEGKGGGLFVKDGAIIPTVSGMNYITGTIMDEIIIDVFPYKDSEFTIFDDDGVSLEYEKGAHSEIVIRSSVSNNMITITGDKRKGCFDQMPISIKAIIRVMGDKPISVKLDGQICDFQHEDGCWTVIVDDLTQGFTLESKTS